MISPMKNINIIFLISAIVAFSFSSSRVSFSRPNSIYKTPGSYFPDLGEGKISLGFSSEIIDLEVPSNSSSAFINAKIKKWNFGLSYTLLPDYRSLNAIALEPLSESPYEVGMHLQRRIYGYKSLYIDVGVHDLSIKNINSNKGLFDDASLFFVVSNNKKFNGYDMAINYGFGTGKLGSDYHNYDDDSGPSMSPFLSILLNTPYFNNKMNLIFEYDGQGLNLGSQIPITEIYSLRFGITHINKITEWAKRAEENNQDFILENDAPAIMFGFIMNIPDVQSDRERIKNQLLSPEGNLYEDIQPLVIIDSARIKAQEIEILNYKDNEEENSIKTKKSSIKKQSTKTKTNNSENRLKKTKKNQTKKKSVIKKNKDIDLVNIENESLRDRESTKDDENKHSEEKTGWWS